MKSNSVFYSLYWFLALSPSPAPSQLGRRLSGETPRLSNQQFSNLPSHRRHFIPSPLKWNSSSSGSNSTFESNLLRDLSQRRQDSDLDCRCRLRFHHHHQKTAGSGPFSLHSSTSSLHIAVRENSHTACVSALQRRNRDERGL